MKKIVSIFVIGALLASLVACNKVGDDGNVEPSESVYEGTLTPTFDGINWFDSDVFYVSATDSDKTDKYGEFYYHYISTYENGLLYEVCKSRLFKDDTEEHLLYCDFDGKVIFDRELDLKKLFGEAGCRLLNCSYIDGKIVFCGERPGSPKLFFSEYDISKDEVTSIRNTELRINPASEYVYDSLFCGNKVFFLVSSFSTEESSFYLVDEDLNVEKLDISGLQGYLLRIENGIFSPNGKLWAEASDNVTGEQSPVVINLSTMESQLMEFAIPKTPCDNSAVSNYSYCLGDDGFVYVKNEGAILMIDPDTQEFHQVFDVDKSICNTCQFGYCSLKSVNDGRILMAGFQSMKCTDSNYITDIYEGICHMGGCQGSSCVMSFHLLDRDPTENKKILHISMLSGDYLGLYMESIYRFNHSQDEYFAVLDKIEYKTEYYYGISGENDQINQLMLKIRSGEGPDVILNTGNHYQINNSDYLLPLDELLTDLSGSGEFFNSMLFCFKMSDHTYSVPYSYGLSGYGVMHDYNADGKYGISYKEYDKFLSDVNFGNPIAGYIDWTEYFFDSLSMMSNELIDSDGNVNLKSDEFKALCGFLKERVQSPQEEFDEVIPSVDYRAKSVWISDPIECFDRVEMPVYVDILGMPSQKGTGAHIVAKSLGISKISKNKDGAEAFIRFMLSDEMQSLFACNRYGTVNKVTLNKYFELGKKTYNNGLDLIYENHQESRYNSRNETCMEYVPEDYLEKYYDTLNHAVGGVGFDSDISLIVYEEIQPYLANQKSLDDCITIMEDRIQKVISERK